MPTHVPKMMRYFYNPFGGRNRSFCKAKMVTHHLEDLKHGLNEKKVLSNCMLNDFEFETPFQIKVKIEHLKLQLLELIMKIAPRSKWIKSKHN
jgi:hypothetical protein